MAIQGKLPCHGGNYDACPYGHDCINCPSINARSNPDLKDSNKKGGFFSASLVGTKDRDGRERFNYRNQE